MHVVLYGVLAALVVLAFERPPSRRRLLLAAVALSLFGAVDEWHQGFVPGRFPSSADWIADTLGVVAGLLTATAARQRRELST